MPTVTILLVGDPTDLTSLWLAQRAAARGCEPVFVDEQRLGAAVHLRHDHVLHHDRRYPLSEVRAAYVRLASAPSAPLLNTPTSRADACPLSPAEAAWFVAERRAGLRNWLDQLAVPVINPSWAGADNASKPLQLQRLARFGFHVPPWVMTRSAEAAAAFLDRVGPCLVKSASGQRAATRPADASVIALLAAGAVPLLLQRHIEGDDVRVHQIGAGSFGARRTQPRSVRSAGDDSLTTTSCEVPPTVQRLCRRWCRDHGLLIAGFDFRVDPTGAWHALEVNPSPTTLPYELGTGVPLADHLLDAVQIPRALAA